MEISIHPQLVSVLEKNTRRIIEFMYSWFTEDKEALGHILALYHFMISTFFFVLVIVSHTIYPSFWLKCIVCVCLIAIWLQHVFLQVCFIVVAEKNLTKKESPYYGMVEKLIGIPGTSIATYFVFFETGLISGLSLEIISEMFVWIFKNYDIPFLS